MWAGVSRLGLPSFSSKPTFISGIERSALTRANPIRWVKETLPPRARARWLLMTMRLSHSSLTGTERTLVAVGTLRLASMLATVRAGAPFRTVYVGSSIASAPSFFSVSLGVGRSAVFAVDFSADFSVGFSVDFWGALSLDVLVVVSFFAAGA